MATDRPDPPPPDANRPRHAPPPGRPRSGLIALVLVALVLLAALAAYLVLEGDPDESDDGAERRRPAVEVVEVDGSA